MVNAQDKALLARAKTADTLAEWKLGKFYEDTGNYKKAFEWLKKVAAKSQPEAYYEIGTLYSLGRLPADTKQEAMRAAFVWISRAAELNYTPALRWMGWYMEAGYRVGSGDVQTSEISTVTPPVQGGVLTRVLTAAGKNKGRISTESSTTTLRDPDYGQASIWYRRGADQGDSICMYALGRFYENGLGLPRNPVLAQKWYAMASDRGNSDARMRLQFLQEQKNADPR